MLYVINSKLIRVSNFETKYDYFDTVKVSLSKAERNSIENNISAFFISVDNRKLNTKRIYKSDDSYFRIYVEDGLITNLIEVQNFYKSDSSIICAIRNLKKGLK